MKTNIAIRMTFTSILAGLFIYLILRQVNLDEFQQAFASASWGWYSAAVFAFIVGYACRIERWRLMLYQENPTLSWRQCAGPFLSCVATNNVLPFRSGDILRGFAFNQQLGISTGVAVSSLFVERILDLFAIMLILGVALIYFNGGEIQFLRISGLATLAVACFLLSLLFFPHVIRPALHVLIHLLGRVFPKHETRLRQELNKGLDCLMNLAKAHMMFRLLNWSIMVWLAEGCVYWLTALALPALVNAAAAWLALPVATLATLIPSTPGYIGSFDYFSVLSMTAMENSAESATVFTVLVHLALWLPTTIAGALIIALGQINVIQQYRSKNKVDSHGNKP